MLTSGVPPIARGTGERQQECRHKVSVDITVVLGTTSMPIHPVLRLGRGAIIELDASEEDPQACSPWAAGGEGNHGGQR
jgi:Type III flagellar switch regulator (C-ring) FliN C-term